MHSSFICVSNAFLFLKWETFYKILIYVSKDTCLWVVQLIKVGVDFLCRVLMGKNLVKINMDSPSDHLLRALHLIKINMTGICVNS